MNIQELRIGNWITEPLNEDKNPFQIWGVYSETKNNKINNLPISYFKPIPLTKDWLIKFGFEKDMVLAEYIKNVKMIGLDLIIGITTNTSGALIGIYNVKSLHTNGINFVRIKYVHQFQNLYFALTGEEL